MKSSIGRPDLGGMVREWAHLLYVTIFKRYDQIEDSIMILPSHAMAVLQEGDTQGIISLTMKEFRNSQAFSLKQGHYWRILNATRRSERSTSVCSILTRTNAGSLK